MGSTTLTLTRCLFITRKPVNINVLRPAVPKLALVQAQQAVITAIQTSHTSMSVPSFVRIERGSDGSS